jgi:four helix bundle protein
MYGLANQLRRAAVSIPSNIAEGHGRVSGREFAHHLAIAYGSLCELETQLLIAQRLGYVDNDTGDVLRSQAAEVGRPINGLSRAIARKTSTTPMP